MQLVIFERLCMDQKKPEMLIVPVTDKINESILSLSVFGNPRRQGIAAHEPSRDTRTQGWVSCRLFCRSGRLCRMARWLASNVWMNTIVNNGGSSMGKGMQAPTIHNTAYRSVKALQEKDPRYQKTLVLGRTHLFKVHRRPL